MKGFVLKLHSFVDVITNSSTTIYTYADNAVEPAKKLLAAILKLKGETRSVDELFSVFCLPDDFEPYFDVASDEDELSEEDKLLCENWSTRYDYFQKLRKEILNGNDVPVWLKRSEYEYSGTSLWIIPKDPSYKELIELMESFLNSTHSKEVYN